MRVAVDQRLRQRVRGLSGREHRRHDQSDDRLPGHDLVLEIGPLRRPNKATADGNGSVCRRNGRALQPRSPPAGTITTPTIAAGYNYPNSSVTCSGSQKCKFIYSVHRQRQSLLLHDFAGPVLFGQGRRRLGNHALREPVGPDDLQVRPLRHERVDVRSAGVHAHRHQVDGHSRERRVRRQSQRPHVCAGDAELRHLVFVLPDADPDDAGSVRHRILGAGPELPRRLSYAARERHAVHEHQGLHHRQQDDLVHQALRGEPEQRHQSAGRRVAHRRALLGQSRGLDASGCHRPARSGDRKMPAELPPAVDRRLLELDDRLHVPRQQRQDGSRPSPICRARRDSPSGRTSRDRITKDRPRPATASRTSPCTTGFATSARPSPTR